MIEVLWAKPLEGPVGEKGMQGAIGMQGEPGPTLTPEQRDEMYDLMEEIEFYKHRTIAMYLIVTLMMIFAIICVVYYG